MICGHSNCGAIKACREPKISELPSGLGSWIQNIKNQLNPTIPDLGELSRENVLNQIENLKQYAIVQERLAKGTLSIHAWFIDLEQHTIFEWNAKNKKFQPIASEETIACNL